MTRTFDLLNLRESGHPGISRLFARAHTHGWNVEKDVDWKIRLDADDPVMKPGWAPYSRTRSFQKLPKDVQARFSRRAFSWTLNSLQLGESVALEVCLKIAQLSRLEDYRNHATAQAMDEARHHHVYVRLIDRMEQEPEEIDQGTRGLFDQVLQADRLVDLVAWEQFYLESVAMNVLRAVKDQALNPLVKRIFALNLRDESRHMGFGVMFVEAYLQSIPLDERITFARRWLNQMLPMTFGGQDPVTPQRLMRWLYDAGAPDAVQLGMTMMAEQLPIMQKQYEDVTTGKRVPQELKSARRAGLMAPEILEALGLSDHPVILGALKSAPDQDADV